MWGVISNIWHRLRHHLNSSTETHTNEPLQEEVEIGDSPYSCSCNSNPLFQALPVLGNVMEALADPNTHLIGVYGSDGEIKDALLQRVHRRIQRDNLFDLVLTATVTEKPDVNKIQDELASQLGLTLNPSNSKDGRANELIRWIARQLGLTSNPSNSKDERANELIRRIKKEHKILIVLRDLYEGLDLGKVGIPYGSDHSGCKILLTSMVEDVLSEHMRTQKNFMV